MPTIHTSSSNIRRSSAVKTGASTDTILCVGRSLVDDRYELRALTGSGGMADVFLAYDRILDRDVALKLLKGRFAQDEEFVERFRREAKSAAALSNPHIVTIFDRGETEDSTYYIAMEYVPGGDLGDLIEGEGRLPPRRATEIALQVAEALQIAHERGVVHRDIKPRNILITGSGHAKVADFGIARAAEATTISHRGDILGSVKYMSPEQAMAKPVGPESDLYSLGVVLYEMLSGRVPFEVKTPEDVPAKHAGGPPPHPMELDPEVPKALDAVAVKLLATDPQDRYGNAAELLEELVRVRDGLPPAVPSPNEATTAVLGDPMVPLPAPPASGSAGGARSRKSSRKPLWILTVLAALIGVLAGLAGLGVLGKDPSRTPNGVSAVHAVEGGPLEAPATGSGIPSAGIPSAGVAGGASAASASASVAASALGSAVSSAAPAPGDTGGGGFAAQEQYR